MEANERIFIRGGPTRAPETTPQIEKIAPAEVRKALAWQERKLLFVETPLHEVAEQFNRRNRVQIVIADAALAMRPVGGTFGADNVETFVRLLETSGDIVAERKSEWEIVLRKSR